MVLKWMQGSEEALTDEVTYKYHKGLKHQVRGTVSLESKLRGYKPFLPWWYMLLPDRPLALATCQNQTLCRPSCY